MRYAIDAEFIGTPTCSALISFAIVREDSQGRYFEFDYPEAEITPWLTANVVPKLLGGTKTTFAEAAASIRDFLVEGRARDFQPPVIWGYYVSYDWYWFCRLFGGFMEMPQWIPYPRELCVAVHGLNVPSELAHNCLHDAQYTLAHALKLGREGIPS